MALLLSSALSINAYVLPGPAVSPMRTSTLAMNEVAAKAAWLAKQDAPAWGPSASAGMTGRVVRTVNPALEKALLKADKAKKEYVGKEVEHCGDRTKKGWTTA